MKNKNRIKKAEMDYFIEENEYPRDIEVCVMCLTDGAFDYVRYKNQKYCFECFIELKRTETLAHVLKIIDKEIDEDEGEQIYFPSEILEALKSKLKSLKNSGGKEE